MGASFFAFSLTFFFTSPNSLQLLGPPTPGKVGGPTSDAFGLLYGREGADLVARRLHRLDPVLARRCGFFLFFRKKKKVDEGKKLKNRFFFQKKIKLENRLRQNVYGDLYADDGLPLSTRQLLMVSHLGEAGMHDELFGHAGVALLAGCSPRELVAAADAGFRAAAEAAEAEAEVGTESGSSSNSSSGPLGARRRARYRDTMATLEAAWARHRE